MRPVAWLLLWALGGIIDPALGANETGQKIFKERCSLCHQEDAHGAAGVAPSLVGTLAPYLASAAGKRYLAQILVSGMIGPIDTEGHKFNGLMPSFRAELSDTDIAAIINYVLGTFNGMSDAAATTPIAPDDVAAAGAPNPAPPVRGRCVNRSGLPLDRGAGPLRDLGGCLYCLGRGLGRGHGQGRTRGHTHADGLHAQLLGLSRRRGSGRTRGRHSQSE